jgi:hypothetical protein
MTSALFVWAMEVMHATLEGSSNEGLGAIGSQGGLLYNNPNLVLDTTDL